ncbi:TBC1 domain family member 16 [Oopsacas minuta]|uniref:TBC1 domain family member 16 n=1 Tax=Oopsacas minuta TaxID=111878 RepID=A0AAV7JH48_9METZ|nr:TBC1 domain family member 16 [Oopsacas minuta]
MSILDLKYEMGEDSWLNLDKAIKQDVSRTDNLACLSANIDERKTIIINILLKFVAFDRKTGYHQGMSDIVSLLYYSIGIEEITFWCFVGLIKYTPYGKKKHIQSSIDECVHKLKELVKLFLPSFYALLSKIDMGLEFIFAHRWIFVNCRREFSLQDSQSILTAILSSHYETEFILYICLAICACYQDEIISTCQTIDDVMQFFLRLSNSIPSKLILRQARCFGYLDNKLSTKKVKAIFQ